MSFRLLKFASITAFMAVLGTSQAMATNEFSLGTEGFRDNYKEPDATVDTHTDYLSVTTNYTHTYNHFFTAIDGRYSWGNTDYKSDSGVLNGVPEFETDLRLRTGVDIAMWHGHVMPYIGVGWRYYFDEGKGYATNLGRLAYDRHISQFYLPIGASYSFMSGNWTYTPMLEGDFLFFGQVNTHLAPIGVDDNVTNTQHRGYGIRSEFMVGQKYSGFGWEVGPFVRYWHVSDSDCKVTTNSAPGTCLLEPNNSRLQTGGALRVKF